ncbi:gamma-glutamyltransferase [Nocardioides mangrovicus]|uniref:Glutathione hydrolase proenzyme n=1 Tax=Nocardioides mangrovicus TaxID=2478913 RepID=A0A3L8P4W6_9ACTN|nr:gamma-glutamyltransferase [Nocardioides mangrovicus]RLV50072.1 gamma-glutamyltransferase [Nocardioides mangrovicus]
MSRLATSHVVGPALALTLSVSGAALAPAFGDAHDRSGQQRRHHPHYNVKTAKQVGTGGAVSSVDPEASKIGRQVLRQGGNATDAIIAMAAALGVTEPYSSGIGGGGYLVVYDAKHKKTHVIDGRETAPRTMPTDAFVDPSTGKPYNFTPELVTSGVSVGTPGTPATWATALRKWGTLSFGQALRPAIKLARRGFVVDSTFHQQTEENKARFSAFDSTRELYLPNGDARPVGAVQKNPDLARTYRLLARKGVEAFYRGPLARQIARTAQNPPKRADTTLPVPKGYLSAGDLKRYRVLVKKPTHVKYRGLDVYGAPPSTSGGTTVGEALQILRNFDLGKEPRVQALHDYLEASALAFADRGAYVGDPRYVNVPVKRLLSRSFGRSRACAIDQTKAFTTPTAAGDLGATGCSTASTGRTAPDTENLNTTNLTAVDRHGNIAEYTLTIEQTGGSGIVVPGRGFLLNNELTDFTNAYDPTDPNRIQGGKRPRSSISPTIVMKKGRPWLALGSPGGATIITTVLQTLVNRIDFGMPIEKALAAPRASQRNTASTQAEQAFIDTYGTALGAFGHSFAVPGAPGTSAAEIGAATAVELRANGTLIAVSEPTRRGGGSALVVKRR